MKKLLGIIIVGLLLCNSSFGQIKIIEREYIGASPRDNMWVTTICVNGYEYITMSYEIEGDYSKEKTASITQSFEVIDGKSLPKKCK